MKMSTTCIYVAALLILFTATGCTSKEQRLQEITQEMEEKFYAGGPMPGEKLEKELSPLESFKVHLKIMEEDFFNTEKHEGILQNIEYDVLSSNSLVSPYIAHLNYQRYRPSDEDTDEEKVGSLFNWKVELKFSDGKWDVDTVQYKSSTPMMRIINNIAERDGLGSDPQFQEIFELQPKGNLQFTSVERLLGCSENRMRYDNMAWKMHSKK